MLDAHGKDRAARTVTPQRPPAPSSPTGYQSDRITKSDRHPTLHPDVPASPAACHAVPHVSHTCLLLVLLLHWQPTSSETCHEPSPCVAPNRQRQKRLALQQCCQALLTPQPLHHHRDPLIIHCAALSSIVICLKWVSVRARLLASSCSFVLTRASRSCCSSDNFLLCRANPRSWAACRACHRWCGSVRRRQGTRGTAAAPRVSGTPERGETMCLLLVLAAHTP